MGGVLVVTKVEKVVDEVARAIKNNNLPCIFISLNKSKEGTEDQLKSYGVKLDNLYFIDLISETGNKDEDCIRIKPRELNKLFDAIKIFSEELDGKKLIIIDSLVTLLIYNNQNTVAAFLKRLTDYTRNEKLDLIAISQETQGEDMLDKIYNFFDKVEKK